MADRDKDFMAYRGLHKRFYYNSYHWHTDNEGLHIAFSFAIDQKIFFTPKSCIKANNLLSFEGKDEIIDTIVFNIGMAELVSYWKCLCPKEVHILCGSLTNEQISFWKKLYWHGLGEFFFTNNIPTSYDDFMTITAKNTVNEVRHFPEPYQTSNSQKSDIEYLVPIGGGKDSVVTLELLKGAGYNVRPLIMNPRGATLSCAEVGGFINEDILVINRQIDPTLLDLNRQGYLNGHTPFSAVLAFYTWLAAECSGVKNVALSNESSANESTVLGTMVNHQYSKSLDFEDDFRHYYQQYSSNYRYFSFLRPLSEIQIAMLFSTFKQYHSVFRSCNAGSKQDIWCGKCAKCLFAYIILLPFIEPQRLNTIFGKDILADKNLQNEFDQLTGHAETKPFECVGTIEEVNLALNMSITRWYKDSRPLLLKDFVHTAATDDEKKLTIIANNMGNLNEEEYKILEQACINSMR